MQRSELAGEFRIALARFGVLRAQIGDGRRLQRLGNGAGIGRCAAAGFDLVVFRLGVERERAGRSQPLIAGRKLLIADQRILGADEIVLRLVDGQRVFGGAQPFLQFLEPARQIGGRAPCGGGLRILGFLQIGGGDRVGEHRRLFRIIRPDVDIDDEGAVGFLDADMTVQSFQRGHLAEFDLVGGMDVDAEQAEQCRHQALGVTAAEFRIPLEMVVLDHLQQHVVRGDHARLTFHHHRQA